MTQSSESSWLALCDVVDALMGAVQPVSANAEGRRDWDPSQEERPKR